MKFSPRKTPFLFLPASLFFASILPGMAQQTPIDYSMPGFSPYYFPPPVHFRDSRILTIVFRTTPETLQRLVPKPLQPNPLNLMFVYISRLKIEAPGGRFEYVEAGIGVPALFGTTLGYFAAGLYLDKAWPIVGGREIWGWPKKDALMTFQEKGGNIIGRVERLGVILLDISAGLDKKADPSTAQPEMPWFLQKIIPSVKRNSPPDVWQLVSTKNIDAKTKDLWNCRATLKIGMGPEDAYGDVKVIDIVSAQFSVKDFTMDYGEILHNYLAKK